MSIKSNLENVRQAIKTACEANNKPKGAVKLIAVSKTVPIDVIMEAYGCGQRVFGENKIQELETKAPVMPDDIEWHLIGHLQSNKAARAIELAHYIHSVDSERLLLRLDRLAGGKKRKPKILLEVNVSGEASKFGLKVNELENCVRVALMCKNLELVGFMTMASFGANEVGLNGVFSMLREEKEKLEHKFDIQLSELSMGMSSDFRPAIANGSTMVRIGTAIFGERN